MSLDESALPVQSTLTLDEKIALEEKKLGVSAHATTEDSAVSGEPTLSLDERIALEEKKMGISSHSTVPEVNVPKPSDPEVKSVEKSASVIENEMEEVEPTPPPVLSLDERIALEEKKLGVSAQAEEVEPTPPPVLSLDERIALEEKKLGVSASAMGQSVKLTSNSTQNAMSELEGAPSKAAEVDSRPLADRIVDKNWKTRQQAYEDLKQKFTAEKKQHVAAGDDAYLESAAYFKAMASDSNGSALDTALNVIMEFLNLYEDLICPLSAPSTRKNFQSSYGLALCNAIIDKALSSSKATSISKSKTVLLKLIELTEDPPGNTGTPASISYIHIIYSKILSDKRMKVPPALLEVVIDCVEKFGCVTKGSSSLTQSYTAVLLKEAVSTLIPTILTGSGSYSKLTKDGCMTLLVAVSRYMTFGTDATVPTSVQVTIIDNLKPAQKTEFEKLCGVPETTESGVIGVPTLYLRRDREALSKKAVESAASGGTVAPDSSCGDGDRDFLPETDLLKKIKAIFGEYNAKIGNITPTATTTPKWSEQLEGLQMIVSIIGSAPKFKPLSSYEDSTLVNTVLRDGVLDVLKHFLAAHNATTTHITLQVHAIKLYGLLVDGYRGEFSTYAKPTLSLLLNKYKDKKLCSIVNGCLMSYFKYANITLNDIFDEIKEIVAHKKTPPHALICIMELVAVVVQEILPYDPRMLKQENIKSFFNNILLCRIEDSDVKTREACTQTVLLFAEYVKNKSKASKAGSKELESLFNGLQTKLPKVHKKCAPILAGETVYTLPIMTSRNMISILSGGSGATFAECAKAPAPGKKTETKTATSVSNSSKSSTSSAPSKVTKKPASKTSTSSSVTKNVEAAPSVPSVNVNEEDEIPSDVQMGVEEATAELAALNIEDWDTTFQENMANGTWQQKVECITAMTTKFQEGDYAHLGGTYSAAIVGYLIHHHPRFKISNMNITKAVLGLLEACASSPLKPDSKSQPFSKVAAWGIIRYLICDKLADKKIQSICCNILTALCESISPLFVVKRICNMMFKGQSDQTLTTIVSPIAHQMFLEWLRQTIVDFGISRFALTAKPANPTTVVNKTASFVVNNIILLEVEHKVATVRSTAIEIAGLLYMQLGPRLLTMGIVNDDTKSQVKNLLEAEFQKAGFDPVSASKVVYKRSIRAQPSGGSGNGSVVASSGGAAASSGTGTAGGVSVDDISIDAEAFPRVDLLSMLPSGNPPSGSTAITITSGNVLAELGNTDGKSSWQNRKAAIEALTQACEKTSYYVEYNKALVDILKTLRQRVTSDTNLNIKPIALQCLGTIVASLDNDSAAKCVKSLSDGFIAGLGDSNKRIRDNCVYILEMVCSMNPKLGMAEFSSEFAAATGKTPVAPNVVLVPSVTGALFPSAIIESLNNSVGRIELLQWCCSYAINGLVISKSNPQEGYAELLTACILQCLQDKLAAVRNATVQFISLMIQKKLITKANLDHVMRIELTPIVKRNIQQHLDAISAAFGDSCATAVSSKAAAPADTVPPKRASKIASAKTSTAASAASATAPPIPLAKVESDLPPAPAENVPCGGFRKSSNRLRRCEEFIRSNWTQPPEELGTTEYTTLKNTWEPLLSSELFNLLFPPNIVLGSGSDMNNNLVSCTDIVIPALDHMTKHLHLDNSGTVEDTKATVVAIGGHLDLILRWCSLMLVTKGIIRESTGGLMKLLQFLKCLVNFIIAHNQSVAAEHSNGVTGVLLYEGEITCIIPHMIDKSGHKSEKHKLLYKEVLCSFGWIIKPLVKYSTLLIQGLGCKNRKSRVVALEVIFYLLESVTGSITACLNRTNVKDIGAYLDAKDNDLLGRNACLEIAHVAYHILHHQYHGATKPTYNNVIVQRVIKWLSTGNIPGANSTGSDNMLTLSDRASSMIDERIKSKFKEGKTVHLVNLPSANTNSSNANQPEQGVADTPTPSKKRSSKGASPSPNPTMMSSRRANSAKKSSEGLRKKEKAIEYMPVSDDEDDEKAFVALMQTPVAPKYNPAEDEDNDVNANDNLVQSQSVYSDIKKPVRTPPVHKTGSPHSGDTWNTVLTPQGDKGSPNGNTPLLYSPVAEVPVTPCGSDTSAVLESMYADILSKIDEMLISPRAVQSSESSSLLYKQTETEVVATDFIKLLHTIITNHASSTSSNSNTPAGKNIETGNSDVLLQHVVVLMNRLLLCLDRAFSTTDGHNMIDVNLTSICLASIFGMIKHRDLVGCLLSGTRGDSLTISPHSDFENYLHLTLQCCLSKLVDDRLLTSNTGASSSSPDYLMLHEYNVSIIRALNMILLKLSAAAAIETGTSCDVLISLLKILCSSPDTEKEGGTGTLPAAIVKPTSRLILKVLSDEVRNTTPFRSENVEDATIRLLNALHEVFTVHPPSANSVSSTGNNDTAFCTAKTVIFQMVKTVGMKTLTELLDRHSASSSSHAKTTIAKQSYLYRLIVRLHSNMSNNSAKNTPVKAVSNEKSTPETRPSLLKAPTPPSSGKSKKASKMSDNTPKPVLTRVTSPSASDNDTLGNTISSSATANDADLISRFRRLKNKQ